MEQFNKLNLAQAAGIGIALTVLYYFLLFNDGSRLVAQTSQIEANIQAQKMTLTKIEKALEDKKRFDQEAEEINTNLEAFLTYFPSDSDQNKLMKDVSKAAELHRATMIRLKPVDQAPEFPNYPEIAFEFEIETTFHQMMKFISELTQLKRAIDFRGTKIKVSRQGENPVLNFKSTLVIYGRKSQGDGA